jgi:hypothetical protein
MYIIIIYILLIIIWIIYYHCIRNTIDQEPKKILLLAKSEGIQTVITLKEI